MNHQSYQWRDSAQTLHASWFHWSVSEFSSPPSLPGDQRSVRWVLCPVRSCANWAGGSGFLGTRGEDHRGGKTVHAQCWNVDLIAAVSGKLKRDNRINIVSVCLITRFCLQPTGDFILAYNSVVKWTVKNAVVWKLNINILICYQCDPTVGSCKGGFKSCTSQLLLREETKCCYQKWKYWKLQENPLWGDCLPTRTGTCKSN